MRKIILLTTTLLLHLFYLDLPAQTSLITFDVLGGVSISNISQKKEKNTAKAGYRFDAEIKYISTENLFFQSGLTLINKGAKKVMLNNLAEEPSKDIVNTQNTYTLDPVYLQLPLFLGYRTFLSESVVINLSAGGYLAYGIGGKSTITAAVKDVQTQTDLKADLFSGDNHLMKRFEGGISFKVGAEFDKLIINMGYDQGLSDITSDSYSLKNRSAYLSLGYRIFSK